MSGRLILVLALAGMFGSVEARQRDPRSGEPLLDTAVIQSLVLAAPAPRGTLSVRITYPDARGRFPIVVLSQGARSTPAMYARLAEHWAARGHVVIQPVPPDLSPIAAQPHDASARRLPATVEARIEGIRLTLGELEQIESRAPVLRGRLDRERVAVAGHSTGALATLLAAGPKLVPSPPSGTLSPHGGERVGARGVDAVILIGDPAKTGIVPDGAWLTLGEPTLLATGSLDEGELPASGVRPDTLFTLGASPESAPRHEIFVRGMDVCLGGLFCRVAPGTTPDPAALAAIAESTSAFLRAHLRRNEAAAQWLRSEAPPDLANGRARFKVYP